MRIHPIALEAAAEITKGFASNTLEGRAADAGASLPWLASMVAAAGPGDHVDIGSLFGASAITAALVKKKLKLDGLVYCIDPFLPRQLVAMPPGMDPKIFEGNPEALMRNAEKAGVELKLIQKSSDPWPDELKDLVFASAYIDGSHIDGMPKKDFLNLRGLVTSYIGWDNYDESYADVLNAANFSFSNECPDWSLYYKNFTFLAVRRSIDSLFRNVPGHNLIS